MDLERIRRAWFEVEKWISLLPWEWSGTAKSNLVSLHGFCWGYSLVDQLGRDTQRWSRYDKQIWKSKTSSQRYAHCCALSQIGGQRNALWPDQLNAKTEKIPYDKRYGKQANREDD